MVRPVSLHHEECLRRGSLWISKLWRVEPLIADSKCIENWDRDCSKRVYEIVLATSLEKRGFKVERQRSISFEFESVRFNDAFRCDILIDGQLLIEVKSVEQTHPVHSKQVLTYLRAPEPSLRLSDELRLVDIQGRRPPHRQQLPRLGRATAPIRTAPTRKHPARSAITMVADDANYHCRRRATS